MINNKNFNNIYYVSLNNELFTHGYYIILFLLQKEPWQEQEDSTDDDKTNSDGGESNKGESNSNEGESSNTKQSWIREVQNTQQRIGG